jgi:DNA modification methylase
MVQLPLNSVYRMNCLVGLPQLATASVDLVFADLPYGRTQNSWDRLVPVVPLWAELNRVCKPGAPMVFTAIQPFTSLLVTSNLKAFRYELIWRKNKPTGFLNAKRQPLRVHESVLVFYRKPPLYRPHMTTGHAPVNAFYTRSSGSNYGAITKRDGGGSTTRCPTSVLDIPVVNNDDPLRVHPTQKPEALIDWFIQAYTRPGDLVLDPTAGSGSTLFAAARAGRRFVGFETDGAMVLHVRDRLKKVAARSWIDTAVSMGDRVPLPTPCPED